MKKWNGKLYIGTIIATIAALVFMVTYDYMSFYSNMQKNMENIGISSLKQVTEQLEGYLEKGKSVVETTAVSVEYMLEKEISKEQLEDYLVHKSKAYSAGIDENFTGIYGVFEENYIDGVGWIPDKEYVPEEREWYLAAMQAQGEPALVSPYLDAQTNTIMISVSQMLQDGKSVISLDITMDKIQEITQDIRLNGIGYGFVTDKDGLVIAHNDLAEKGKNYLEEETEKKELIERVYLGKDDCFEMKLQGRNCNVFSNILFDDWYVVMVVDKEALLSDVNAVLVQNILICGLIFAMIIFFYMYTIRKLRRSAEYERESNRKIELLNKNMIRALVRTIDAKDRYTNGHSLRVADYALEIAKRMKKTPEEQEKIYYAGLLHDVGKIRIPEDVINKPGRLTDEEFEQIKIHPVTGYHILKDIYEDKTIATGGKFHHERYDGKGYPLGLSGENIPEVARIIGVADTYDAMASNRSYRQALPQEVVRSEIEKGKGTQFDPEIADVMLQMIDEDTEYRMKEVKSLLKTILVIDDEPMNIKMVKLIMKDEPTYQVVGGSNAEEAMEALRSQSVNLILLDLVMPDEDGFEVLSKIREVSDVPVIFMTGDKNIETIKKAMEAGVEDYITKPFLPLTLKEVIHSIIQYN